MSRPAIRVAAGIVIALILLLAGGGALVWWKLSTVKDRLVRSLGDAIGAQVQISSLDLDIWKGELHAAGISLTNQRPDAPWDSGAISQATVHFHLRDLLSPTLPVTVEVSSWNIVLHSSDAGATPTVRDSGLPSANSWSSGSGAPQKGRVQVTQISAQDGTVEVNLGSDRKVTALGVTFQSSDNGGGVWNTHLQATSLTAGTFMAGPVSTEIRGDSDKVSFSDLRMQCDTGAVTGSGEISLDSSHDALVDLKGVDIPVTMLVSINWQMKLSGLASGDVHYQSNAQGADAKGDVTLNHAKFNVLPMLGKVTSLVGLQDISGVEVDKATSDFEWKDGTLHLSNIDIRKEGVTRIAGNVDVGPTEQVDGQIKLGLPSTITGKWPQLQTAVFPVQSDDYNWADVHVTGTPDHLQEDLSARLLAVGLNQGNQMLNTSGDLINQATQKATDLINNVLGTGK